MTRAPSGQELLELLSSAAQVPDDRTLRRLFAWVRDTFGADAASQCWRRGMAALRAAYETAGAAEHRRVRAEIDALAPGPGLVSERFVAGRIVHRTWLHADGWDGDRWPVTTIRRFEEMMREAERKPKGSPALVYTWDDGRYAMPWYEARPCPAERALRDRCRELFGTRERDPYLEDAA